MALWRRAHPRTVIARGSAAIVLAPAIVMVAILAGVLVFESTVLSLLTIPFGLAFLAFLFFFRDPSRTVGPGIVSPADGRVLVADRDTGRVAIFMGVTNAHVNRAPMAGVVASKRYRPGRFAIASRPGSEANERLEWTFRTDLGVLRLAQVAGIFARRIVPYIDVGDKVKKGQRIGLVRFGSRVELSLPRGCLLRVAAGDRVRAGETTIAEVANVLGS
jgi:phosphatidylserine decarboxylase